MPEKIFLPLFTSHGIESYNKAINKLNETFMAFYQKYRPKTFADLIGEDHISKTLLSAIANNNLSHAYLLCGPRGTGKTTTARLLAKAFDCLTLNAEKKSGQIKSGEPCNNCDACREIDAGRAVDVIEIDAASHTKVDEIREVIDNAAFAPNRFAKKVYIIDEVHMLSNSSFNALLKTLEEPPKHVIFILATTEVHKLPATILSRTQRYDFHRISKNDIKKNLKKIAEQEKIKIDDDALELLAVNAEGVHRDAIGLLEQISSVSKDIKKIDVENILGLAETDKVFSFLRAIFNANSEEGLKIAHGLYADGCEMSQFNKSVIEALRKILLYKMSGKFLFDDTKENYETIEKLSQNLTGGKIVELIDVFIKSGQLLKEVSEPLLPIEMAVVEAGADKKSEIKNQKTEHQSAKTEQIAKPQSSTIVKMEIIKPEKTPTVEVFQMPSDVWQKIVDAVKKENSTLAALLRDAKPVEVSDKKVVLDVRFKFHKDKISEKKNSELLEKIICRETGNKNCLLECKIAEFKTKIGATFASDEELQEAAEEIFA